MALGSIVYNSITCCEMPCALKPRSPERRRPHPHTIEVENDSSWLVIAVLEVATVAVLIFGVRSRVKAEKV
jgi:hypothetical protein